jgi:hypothetical protein
VAWLKSREGQRYKELKKVSTIIDPEIKCTVAQWLGGSGWCSVVRVVVQQAEEIRKDRHTEAETEIERERGKSCRHVSINCVTRVLIRAGIKFDHIIRFELRAAERRWTRHSALLRSACRRFSPSPPNTDGLVTQFFSGQLGAVFRCRTQMDSSLRFTQVSSAPFFTGCDWV